MKRIAWAPTLAALSFALLSLAILPYPGLQNDELFFTGPLYAPNETWFSIQAWGMKIPLMLTSYSGALKTWLYAALFGFFAPSRWSVRVPMVLAGVITIWLTWMWARRIAGSRAAAFAVALLATDAIFIVTNTLDWGPVAFQHVFLMGGLLAVQTWLLANEPGRSKSRWMLALGFFLWGVGLWDKALLVWPLGGLAVAAVCVYPRQLIRHLRPIPVAIATVSILLGALPLVWYNVARPGETASTNTRLNSNEMPMKIAELRYTTDGSILLGTMVSTTAGPLNREPKTAVERLSVALKRHIGAHPRNWMLPAMTLAFICLVLLLRTPLWRILVFLLITMTVAWLQMALNVGTGTAPHHVILLWPFPCVFVGIALSGVAERLQGAMPRVMTALVAVLVAGNLLNTNEYLANLTLNGTLGGWTNAFYRLPGAVSPYKSEWIGIVDWGYLNGLRMMYEGDLKLFVASDFVHKSVMTADDQRQVLTMASSPGFVFIQHTDNNQLFAGVNDQLRAAALAIGYVEHVERVVHDNEGRPVFEIFRFVKAGA